MIVGKSSYISGTDTHISKDIDTQKLQKVDLWNNFWLNDFLEAFQQFIILRLINYGKDYEQKTHRRKVPNKSYNKFYMALLIVLQYTRGNFSRFDPILKNDDPIIVEVSAAPLYLSKGVFSTRYPYQDFEFLRMKWLIQIKLSTRHCKVRINYESFLG